MTISRGSGVPPLFMGLKATGRRCYEENDETRMTI